MRYLILVGMNETTIESLFDDPEALEIAEMEEDIRLGLAIHPDVYWGKTRWVRRHKEKD